jgi:hypothetical protein
MIFMSQAQIDKVEQDRLKRNQKKNSDRISKIEIEYQESRRLTEERKATRTKFISNNNLPKKDYKYNINFAVIYKGKQIGLHSEKCNDYEEYLMNPLLSLEAMFNYIPIGVDIL